MQHVARLAGPVLALCALASCAMPAAPGSGLAHTEWAIVGIDGKAPAAPDRARIGFEEARFSASVGCNRMGGDYRIDGDRLIAGEMMATRMYCEGPVWAQEQAVNALLAGAPAISRAGDRLKLESAGHSIEAQARR